MSNFEIGICFKNSIRNHLINDYNQLYEKMITTSDTYYDTTHGILFYFKDINWSSDNSMVNVFHHILTKFPVTDYLIVEVNLNNYKSSNVQGEWKDNPWNLELYIEEDTQRSLNG
jgi:hypothetical protein